MLHGSYSASALLWPRRLPSPPPSGYVFPSALGSTQALGSPRFLDCSFGTRHPQPPRQAQRVLLVGSAWFTSHAVSSPPVSGFAISGRVATCISVTRPNRVHECCGSRLRLPRLRRAGYPTRRSVDYGGERAITTVGSFHPTRPARLGLAHQRRGGRRERHAERWSWAAWCLPWRLAVARMPGRGKR